VEGRTIASPINTQLSNADDVWIPTNHWGPPVYAALVTVTGTVVYQLEGTFDRINRGEAPVSWVLDDASGIPIVGETVTKCFNLQEIPLEFIRVNQTAGGGTVAIHLVQQGLET
jgi:hypothetical protein